MKLLSILRVCAALLVFYPAFQVHAQEDPSSDSLRSDEESHGNAVPEIDPSMAVGGLALASGLMLVVRGRRKA